MGKGSRTKREILEDIVKEIFERYKKELDKKIEEENAFLDSKIKEVEKLTNSIGYKDNLITFKESKLPILISLIAVIISFITMCLQYKYSQADYEYLRDPKFSIKGEYLEVSVGTEKPQVSRFTWTVSIKEKNNMDRLYFISPTKESYEISLDNEVYIDDHIKKYIDGEYAKGYDYVSKDGKNKYFYRFIAYSSLDDSIEVNALYNKITVNDKDGNESPPPIELKQVDKIKLYEFENAHKDDPNYEGERIIAKKYRELEEYFKDYL